jgi:hypothetical protein
MGAMEEVYVFLGSQDVQLLRGIPTTTTNLLPTNSTSKKRMNPPPEKEQPPMKKPCPNNKVTGDDDELTFDLDNLDPSFLVTDDADQCYLESLPELQHEAILGERFEKSKNLVDMSKALKEAARLRIGEFEKSNNLEGMMVAVVEKATESLEETKVSEVQEPVLPIRRAKCAKSNSSSRTMHVTRSSSQQVSDNAATNSSQEDEGQTIADVVRESAASNSKSSEDACRTVAGMQLVECWDAAGQISVGITAEETVELLLALEAGLNPVAGPPHPLSPTVNEPYDPVVHPPPLSLTVNEPYDPAAHPPSLSPLDLQPYDPIYDPLHPSSNKPYEPSDMVPINVATLNVATLNAASMDLGFDRNPTTLAQRLTEQKWPVRQRAKAFTTNHTLLELRLTENNEFKYQLTKCYEDGNAKKKITVHCVV